MEEVLGFKEHVSQKVKPPKKSGPPQTLTYNGITKKLTEWAKDRNLNVPQLRARLRKGKTIGQALGFDS